MGERIVIDPKVMVGKPVVKGTRITVEAILKLLSAGASVEEILEDYPQLKKEDVKAALDYSAKVIANEEVYPLTGGKRAKVPGG
jgi:uncharacterized protein (DUF433 family)